MSAHDLIYPGDLADFRVGPRIEDSTGALVPPADDETAHFWAVYIRPNTGDVADQWGWVADFNHEIDAREYAARRAKES